jgi:hypothetical protein
MQMHLILTAINSPQTIQRRLMIMSPQRAVMTSASDRYEAQHINFAESTSNQW